MTTKTVKNTVAIIGTGVIGIGWITRLLANGHRVIAWDPSDGFADRVRSEIDRLWPTLKQAGLAATADAKQLTCALTLEEACADAWFIQESVPENLDIKHEVHRRIDQASSPTAIVASSSSGLLPTEIQKVCEHPERFLIGHPFNPVYLLPLVELVPGESTDPETMTIAKTHYESLNMHPLVLQREIEGYLSDRLQEALWREALHLVNDGIATTEQLDDAIIYGPGLRWAIMGTCLTFHLAGGQGGMKYMLEQFGPALKLPWTHLEAPELTDELIARMVDGTSAQAKGQSIEDLEKLRDNCLIDIMKALSKFQVGAGKLIQK
ncbi:MAG: carnitine 3-dehydrogenase [Candidatus Azotimanducaceae bacterium]|jgi:carnitine 3-dehydrogenase